MSRISSTTLFNFTDSLDHLIDNLENGFYCPTLYEKLPVRNCGYRAPMVCFCDIPLSLIREHLDWYGKYGIGINRTYARKLGVTPIWYVTSEHKLVRKLVGNRTLSAHDRVGLLPYLKQFIGFQNKLDGKPGRKKFYDEREWRYVPPDASIEPLFRVKKDAVLKKPVDKAERMPLDLKAVEYIIIDDEKDLEPVFEVLKKVSRTKGVSYNNLVSKLLTAKQILRDF